MATIEGIAVVKQENYEYFCGCACIPEIDFAAASMQMGFRFKTTPIVTHARDTAPCVHDRCLHIACSYRECRERTIFRCLLPIFG